MTVTSDSGPRVNDWTVANLYGIGHSEQTTPFSVERHTQSREAFPDRATTPASGQQGLLDWLP